MTESEVVVCARRPEEERYRIPPRLRRGNQPVEQAWSSRVDPSRDRARFAPEQLLGGRHLRLHRLRPADDPAMDGQPPRPTRGRAERPRQPAATLESTKADRCSLPQ